MKRMYFALILAAFCVCGKKVDVDPKADPKLGLPILEVPENNPITNEKVALGQKLFNDTRFSATKTIACQNCHKPGTGFTDSPLRVSEGINKLTGTRNAPTVINAAYNKTQFLDGRSPNLEDQALHPFLNPVEMGLKDHNPILAIARTDADYKARFQQVFGKSGDQITMTEVTRAIAAFERTILHGNSRFDQWYYLGKEALNDSEKRGFQVFIGKGRCVSCHAIEYTTALFTDHKFQNIGVGINKLSEAEIKKLTDEFLSAKYNTTAVDEKVLRDPKTSELGRFAVTLNMSEVGAFKTPTLRNIDLTPPYMHDGSLKTLEDVVEHYNRGGASSDSEKINPYLSGGIRPLDLTSGEKKDLVAFMKALTSLQLEK